MDLRDDTKQLVDLLTAVGRTGYRTTSIELPSGLKLKLVPAFEFSDLDEVAPEDKQMMGPSQRAAMALRGRTDG